MPSVAALPRRSRGFRAALGIAIASGALVLTCAHATGPEPQNPPGQFLLADLNVVDVRSGSVTPNSDLLIVNGRIAGIGPRGTVLVPSGTLVIPQAGRFAIPGLIDMHAHLSAEDDAPRMLSYGITAARHMADVPWWTKLLMGFPDGRELRDRIRFGELPGPDLIVGGLVLDGEPPVSPLNEVVTDPVKARKIVARQVADGYDFIKVYDRLSVPVFDAILAEAAAKKIPVIGHAPVEVGIERALRSSMASVEHVTGYVDQHHVKFLIDSMKLREYAEMTKQSGKVNCPTLVVWRNIPPKDSFDLLKQQPGFQYLSWRVRWLWKTTLGYIDKKPYTGHDITGDMTRYTVAMTKALHDAGAPIVAGTDMNFLGVYPGVSLHLEMEYLRDAGLSNLDALRAATITAARALGQETTIGSIEVGKRANLVIIDANPLTDIRATRTIREVFKDGRRLPTDLRRAWDSPR